MRQRLDPVTEVLSWLDEKGVYAIRCSAYHIKIDDVNYYPHKGTIILDTEAGRRREGGLKALESLLIAKGLIRPQTQKPS
jgi:hypothetical protein